MDLNQTVNASLVPTEIPIITLSLVPFISITSLLGNSLVMWLTVKTKSLNGPMSILVITLAICNLIITMFPGLMFTVENALGEWPFSTLCCVVSIGVEYSTLTFSNVVMVGIAVERYFAVVMPLKNLSTRRRTRWILITGLAAALLNCLGFNLLVAPSLSSKLSSSKYECHIGWASYPNGLSGKALIYFIATFLLLILIPFITMLCLYGKIIYATYKTERPGKHTDSTTVREKKRKHRMTKMLISTLILFQICWLPSYIQELTLSFDKELAISIDTARILDLVTSIMGYSHSAFNPLMYPIFNKNYRTALKKFLQGFIIKVRGNYEMIAVNDVNQRGNHTTNNNVRETRL